MAQVPQLRAVSLEDYADAPEWFHRFVETLNPFLANVTDALNGNLTSENFRRQDEAPFILDTESTLAATFAPGKVQIKNRLGAKPVAVTLIQCEPQSPGDAPTPGPPLWQLLQNGMIQIDMIPGLTVSKRYRLSFRIE